MADARVTDLTALAGANIATGDTVHIVDVSDTTQNAAGSSKKTTIGDVSTALQALGLARKSGDPISATTLTSSGATVLQTLTVGLGGSTTVATNTAVGVDALDSASLTGNFNTAVGHTALSANTTGGSNNALGYGALSDNTTGNSNTAVGHTALSANTTGGSNTAVGHTALSANTTGVENSAVGHTALSANTTGVENSAVGSGALSFNTTGNYNTALGRRALFYNTTSSNNSAVGYAAGDVITTGARNTIIGGGSDPSAATGNDQTVIGQGLTGKGDDTAFIGGTNGAYNEKNVTTWETTSDSRIKKNIADFAGGLDVVEQIRVRTFCYRAPDEITDLPASAAINQPGEQIGVIAQELATVLPGCVTENSTGVLSVSTDPLMWYLVNAVKQLAAEVRSLKGG